MPNKGGLKAQEAKEICVAGQTLALPDFGDLEPSKEASDWNDFMRLFGGDQTKAQLAGRCLCDRL